MSHYRIGRIEGNWVNFTPPIRGGFLAQSTKNSATEIPTDPISVHAEQLSQFFSTTTPTLELSLEDDSPAVHGPPMTIDNTQLVKQALEDDLDQYPSLDAVTQHAIVEKYRNLHQKIKDEGYYDCQYREYAKEMGRYLCILTAFLIALRSGWFIISAALLGLFWVYHLFHFPTRDAADFLQHQIMFTAHDAGHQGITHNFVVDTLIGMFIADFCCGLSIGWWKSSHNVHHLVTNHHASGPISL